MLCVWSVCGGAFCPNKVGEKVVEGRLRQIRVTAKNGEPPRYLTQMFRYLDQISAVFRISIKQISEHLSQISGSRAAWFPGGLAIFQGQLGHGW